MKRLIILRPEPGASESAAKAAAFQLDAVTVPLFAVRPLVWRSLTNRNGTVLSRPAPTPFVMAVQALNN